MRNGNRDRCVNRARGLKVATAFLLILLFFSQKLRQVSIGPNVCYLHNAASRSLNHCKMTVFFEENQENPKHHCNFTVFFTFS